MANKHKEYGNASQVTTHIDSYADGGKAKPEKGGDKSYSFEVDGKERTVKGKTKAEARAKLRKSGVTPKSMADGGKAVKKKKKKPSPKMLGTGAAAAAGRAVSGRQRQIDKALEDAGA